MLTTLGIEKNDYNDEDFLPEDEEDDDNEGDEDNGEDEGISYEDDAVLLFGESEDEFELQPVHKQKNNAEQINIEAVTSDMETSTSENEAINEDQSSNKKRKLEGMDELSVDDVCEDDEDVAMPEYTPRKRSSKHIEELDSMAVERSDIAYKKKYNLEFRVRSSETTALYNRSHDNQMPTNFKWTHKVYRCTHGVSQESRSKGHRNRKRRYCGCKARLTPTVTRVNGNTYAIVIRNEDHTHWHPTSSTKASSYLTTKTLPLDDEDREDVRTLADARVSSTHIAQRSSW
ncbi:hypothetical protein PC121_g11098 [Phytophthora cactorum]|nr:hypothetical protein PC121_g11098 [Phytophthora cactorum]